MDRMAELAAEIAELAVHDMERSLGAPPITAEARRRAYRAAQYRVEAAVEAAFGRYREAARERAAHPPVTG